MARPYRLQGEGYFYHITSRGDGRKRIYISGYDYEKFLEYIMQAKEKYKFHLYAYVLMSNHYHLLLETTQPNLSKIMHYINGAYTTYYNIKRKKSGHLFQGRYKSIVIDKDSYFKEVSRYIHLNPVRAKLVDKPDNYKWSSYHGYVSKRKDELIDKKQIKMYLDMTDGQYRQFVLDGIGKESKVFDNVYAGFIVGRINFIKDTLKELKLQVENKEFSYRKALQNIYDEGKIIDIVAKAYGREAQDLFGMKNKPLEERKVAIYLLKRFTGLTNPEIGKKFGISFSAVSKAAKNIEVLMGIDKRVKHKVGTIISSFKG